MNHRDRLFIATPFTDETGQVVPHLEEAVSKTGKRHWLETSKVIPTEVELNKAENLLVVENEFVRRIFKIPEIGQPEFYTASYENKYTQQEMLKEDVKGPEVYLGLYDGDYSSAYKGTTITREPEYFFIGGEGKGDHDQHTFVYAGHEIKETCEAPFEWEPHPKYGSPCAFEWPPKGVKLTFFFEVPKEAREPFKGVSVKLIYEMYDGIPAMKKRVEIINEGPHTITVGKIAPEVIHAKTELKSQIHVETTYTCGTESTIPINTELPCGDTHEPIGSPFGQLVGMKHSCYELGPAYELEPGEQFISFDTYTLLLSTYWFELKGKEIKGMYERLFPWTTDNPLTFHHTGKLTKEVIDHAAEVGFEMVIQSFGSWDVGYSKEMLVRDKDVLNYYKGLIDYAHSKGIDIGFYQAQYTLTQYRDQGPEYGSNDQGTWGTWCMATEAFGDYMDKFKQFIDYTGVDCVEIDGTYPGCACGNGEKHRIQNTTYKVHKGYFDSVVKQWENAVRHLTREMRKRHIYVKVPAWYYLNGGNKGGIGYEEVAWSQPRREQLVYGRQIIHNSAYGKKLSQSWSHIPFVVYHGGGSEASYTPFVQNIRDYNWVLAQNIGNGITSDYRGQYLFEEDGGISKGVISKWVKFYKRYRGIIDSDLVAIKQADYEGSFDMLYHVNAKNPREKGLLWVYNQTNEVRTEIITVPMYYTGLTNMKYPSVPLKGSLGKNVKSYGTWPPNYDWIPDEEAHYTLPAPTGESVGQAVFQREGSTTELLNIDSNGNVMLKVTMEPMSFVYYMIYAPSEVHKDEEEPIICQVESSFIPSQSSQEEEHFLVENQSFTLNGETDYIDLGYGKLNGSKDYCIHIAINTTSLDKQVIISQGQEGRGLYTGQGLQGNYEVDDFTLEIEKGIIRFIISDISLKKEVRLESKVPIELGEWVEIKLIYHDGTYTLYIGDKKVDEMQEEGLEINTRNSLLLGAIKNHAGGSHTHYFKGEIRVIKLENHFE
ncbi:MAG: hypothetical protein KHY44_10760 [Clostridiales bacterium]|nr:hypothetical protein [Clostridiales bacterium]